MNCRELLKKINEYRALTSEREQLSKNYAAFEERKTAEINARYSALADNIQRFCGSDSFRSLIKNFCYLYPDKLSVSGGNLLYRGALPPVPAMSGEDAFALAEQSVNEIKAAGRVLSQKSGDTDAAAKQLSTAFFALRTINAKIGEWKEQAVQSAVSEERAKMEMLNQKAGELLRAYPELQTSEKIEEKLAEVKNNAAAEVDRFRFQEIAAAEGLGKPVCLPFARNTAAGEYESGIEFWNPGKDGILHVNIPGGRYETAPGFIIGLIVQFLYSYPALKTQILYCCQNSLSRMDVFLKTLKDVCKENVFFRGIEQLEADTFYREIGVCFRDLRAELRRRAGLLDESGAKDIYEYNGRGDADVLPPVLIILHDYPTGFSGCRDLGYFFREGAKYGVFCAVLQTGFGKERLGGEISDPSEYDGIHCEMAEDGRIMLGGNACEGVFLEASGVRPLLKELAEKAEKEKKNSYLSYEDIGFGTIDRAAEGYCTKISIPIGKVNNKVFSLDFATSPSEEDLKRGIKTPLAYLVVGGPGSGKSTLIDSLVINGSMAYSPDDLIFYLLDFKDGVTASFYDGEDAIPHVRMIASRSKEEDSDIILSGLLAEKERRNELIKACGAADIAGYNDKSDKKMPRIIVIVDECQNLFASDILAEKCEKLAREGRSSGIHLVLASQDAKLNMMQHAGKFIDGRFCFFTPDKNDAAQVIGARYARSLNVDVPKGSGLAYMSLDNGDNCEKIQIAYHGGDKSGNKAEYNRQIREKWKKVNYGINLIKAGENRPLLLNSYSETANPLLSEKPAVANIGENYFDHSIFGIDFSKPASHSVLLLGDREKPSSDILTSVIVGALSSGGEVKLIDESVEMPLAGFFGSHPCVTVYTKDEYLTALGEVYEEFERRKQNFRAKYKPYFFIVNALYRIDDYKADKTAEQSEGDAGAADIDAFDGDMAAFYASITSKSVSEKSISGKTTLLTMLSEAGNVGNMYIVIASNSNLGNDYDERAVFANCGYKILQKDVGAAAYQIMDNSFREKMMDGLNENIVFISNRGDFSKCRYFQYDWNSEKTKQMVVSAASRKQTT